MCESIELKVTRPMKIKTNNVGAMFTAETANATKRTRHVDVKYHYMRQEIENGDVELEFVRSEDNLADMFTKNVSKAIMDLHKTKFMTVKPS